jgi:hypothetical protein
MNQKMNLCNYKIRNVIPDNLNLYTEQVFDNINMINVNDCFSLHTQVDYFYHYLYNEKNTKKLIELMVEETDDQKLFNYIHVLAILFRSTDDSTGKKTDYIYKPLSTVMLLTKPKNSNFIAKLKSIFKEKEDEKKLKANLVEMKNELNKDWLTVVNFAKNKDDKIKATTNSISCWQKCVLL